MDRAPLRARHDAGVATSTMDNPVVGGYTPEKVALRRAIALAYDSRAEIRLVRKSARRCPRRPPSAPLTFGYDPNLQDDDERPRPGRARALLDMYGYVDRDGDGWREMPDGAPLLLEYSRPSPTRPAAPARRAVGQGDEGGRPAHRLQGPAKWPENLKASRAGKLMMWGVGWSAATPTATPSSRSAYGPNKGGSEPRALRPAGLQRALRSSRRRHARRARAPAGDRRRRAS